MKHAVLVGTLIAALGVPVVSVSAQFSPPAAGASLGTVTLNRRVMADGKPLAPGTYQVRLDSVLNRGDLSTNFKVAPGDVITVPERML